MSTPFQLHLLRRTLAALVAMSGLGFTSAVQAQGTVTLTGASGNNCSYSAMSITPNGNVNVTCSGSPPPPPPPPPTGETFAMSVANLTAPVGGIVNWSVVRNGPAGTVFGATTVQFSYSGSGCALNGTYPVAFEANQMSSPISAPMAGNGICTATLVTPPSPASLASPTSTVITVGTGGPTTPPISTAGCPTGYVPPEEMVTASLGGQGNLLQQLLRSGQTVSMPMPAPGGNWNSGTITMSEGATSPQPVTIEMSLNKCPGLIEPDNGTSACNVRTTFGHNNKVQFLTRPYGGFNANTPPETLRLYGMCWAGDSNSQYYMNVRWTYPSCQWGICGYAFQFNPGPY